MFGAESLNELDVLGFSASLDKNAEVSLTFVEGLCRLTKTASQTIVDKCVLQETKENLLEEPLQQRAFP